MPNTFIRYAADIEKIDPRCDELLEEIVAFWEKKGRESPASEGTGRAVRAAHAKTFGVVEANVEFLDGLPAEYAQPNLRATRAARGADSILEHVGASGAGCTPRDRHWLRHEDVRHRRTELMDEEPDATTFDLVLKNTPLFHANTARGSAAVNRDQAAGASGGGWSRLGGRPRRRGATQAGTGTRYQSSSRSSHGWSVRPAAIAGVQGSHLRPLPAGAG
jgi:hypothetical protein